MKGPIGTPDQAIRLLREGGAPLFEQIAEALERRIRQGEIGLGMHLPAERTLARTLGVNRATVTRAYRLLESRGLVASRVGSGTTVIGGPRPEPSGAGASAYPSEPSPAFSRGIRELARAVSGGASLPASGSIDFLRMYPDVELFPPKRLAGAVQAALERGSEVLQYGCAAGLEPLRRAIASRLEPLGIEVSPAEVLVVNGIQQALDLLAKVLLEPGDAVVVEAPTYANVLPLLRLYGAQTIGVPLDAGGLAIGPLEQALARHRPKVLYTIPSFHNPTGVTMSRERRVAVLRACRDHGTLVVEDAYEEELRYWGEPLQPLMALAGLSGGVYLGTFSKGLFPGLRLGYVAARAGLLDMLTLAKRFTDYHAGLLSQAVLAEILERGDYDRHLEQLRRTYGARMRRVLLAMEKHLPAAVRWRAPEGGYSAWLELPEGLAAREVADEARRRGVLVLHGGPFYDGVGEGERALRLSISQADPERLEEGIGVLADVIEALLSEQAEGGRRAETAPLV